MCKRVGSNIIKVVESARTVIDTEARKIGEGVKVSYLFDDSKDVRNLLSDLGNVAAAVIIVMVVVLAVLVSAMPPLSGWRYQDPSLSVSAFST